MISTTKKIIYGGAIAGAFALALPALLEARHEAPQPERAERGADETSPAQPQRLDAGLGSVASPEHERSAATPAAVHDGATSADSLARLVGALERMEGSSSSNRRARIEASSSGEELPEDPAVEPVPSLSAPDSLRRVDELTREFEEFLERAPLIGLIRGAGGSSAMFGGRIVHVGDELLQGAATVLAIDAHSVRVELAGHEQRIELPAVQPRLPANSESTATKGSLEHAQAAGNSSAQSAPATPANNAAAAPQASTKQP